MNKLDLIIIAVIALTAFGGYKRGLIGTALAFVGLLAGAVIGSRIAPHLLSGGSKSHYTALIGLAGGAVGVAVGRIAASIVAKFIRGGLRLLPPLHLLDSLGGAAVGALWGVVLVWILGAVALQIHGHPAIKRDLKHSKIITRLDKIAPPHDVLKIPEKLAVAANDLLALKR